MTSVSMKQAVVASLFVAACIACAGSLSNAFLATPTRSPIPTHAGRPAGNLETKPFGDCQSAMAVMGAGLVLGGAAALIRRNARSGKTAARYTTQRVVPAFSWVKANVKESSLVAGELLARTIGGCDVAIGKTASGKLFAVGDKSPPTGTSLSIGGEVVGDTVVDGQYGSSFNVFTGDVMEWCPTPPIVGPLIGSVMGGPQMIAVFDVRTSFLGNDVEVLVDINAKKAYEANYWKGVLDAQGKDDGTYY